MAVAVEVLRLTREADHRVPELLVVGLPRVEAGLVDDHVAGGQDHVGHAAVDEVELGQQLQGGIGQAREIARGRLEVLGEAAQLVGAEQAPGLVDPRERGRDRRRRRREGGVEAGEGAVGGLQRRREQADRLAQVALLGRERPRGDVEVGDQVLERALVAVEGRGDLAEGGDQLGEVVGLGALAGFVDDRRVTQRRRAVAVGVVEGLRGALALGDRVGVGVRRGVRLAVEALAELDRRAVLERWLRRAPGPEVHEEVALEEDARPDLDLGVAVDRQAGLLDLHLHQGGVRGLAVHLVGRDRLDLADVDAGDAHRRVLADGLGRREHGLEAVALGERDVLAEAEVAHDDDAEDQEQPRLDRAHAGAILAHDEPDRHRVGSRAVLAQAGLCALASEGHYFLIVVTLCARPWLPGSLPITLRPAR